VIRRLSFRSRRQRAAALTVAVFAATAASIVATSPAATGASAVSGPRAAFIADADRVCAEAHANLLRQARAYEKHKLSRASGAGTKNRTVAKPVEVGSFATEVAIPEIEATLKRLRLLRPPAADRALYAELLGQLSTALARVKKAPQAASWEDPFAAVDEQLRDFGFQVCGHKPGDDPASKAARK
jgi:hypothetical protein